MGLLATDMVYEYGSTVYQRLSKLDAADDAACVRGAGGAGPRRSSRRTALAARSDPLQRVCDCRYLGQGYELRVDVPAGAIDDDWIEKVRADFHDIHEREYSRRFEESDIELPNVRVRGIGLMPQLQVPEVEHGGGVARAGARPRGRRLVPGRRRAEAGVRRATTTASSSWQAKARRAGDRQPVRLDDRRSRRGSRPTSTASGTSSSRWARPRRPDERAS